VVVEIGDEVRRVTGSAIGVRRDPQRLTRRLVARLQTLGNTVTITPNPA
jgi:hypothetical protein